MQISEKSIQDTIAFIVAACRRGSAECHADFMVDDYYWHSRSKLEGIRLLFVDYPHVLARISTALMETDFIRADAKARLVSGQLAD